MSILLFLILAALILGAAAPQMAEAKGSSTKSVPREPAEETEWQQSIKAEVTPLIGALTGTGTNILNDVSGILGYGSASGGGVGTGKGNGLTSASEDTGNSSSVGSLLDQANSAQAELTKGIVPQTFNDNFQKSIADDVQSSVGSLMNNLGASGTLNSSVMSQGLGQISQSVADASADNYWNSLSYLNEQATKPLENTLNTTTGLTSIIGSLTSPAIQTLWNNEANRYGAASDTVVHQSK